MRTRREFLITSAAGLPALAYGLLTLPLAAQAQHPARIFRVGVIGQPRLRDAFRQGLLEHGWIEGKNMGRSRCGRSCHPYSPRPLPQKVG